MAKPKSSTVKEPKIILPFVNRKENHRSVGRRRSSKDMMQRSSPVDVNEEYILAVRTKSYNEIYTKVHRRLTKSNSTPSSTLLDTTVTSPSPSPISNNHLNLSDYLYLTDENENNLLQSIRSPNVHSLFHDYFLTCADACRLCSTLLVSIHRVRRHQQTLYSLLAAKDTNFLNLASYVELENPLTHLKLYEFQRVRERYALVIRRLTQSHRKIKRRVKIVRSVKHTSGAVLVIVFGGLTVAVLVVASHGLVGAVAAACPVAIWLGWFNGLRSNRVALEEKQVDAAAKGAYIVRRGLETIGSIVTRLHDEIEHEKDLVKMFLKSKGDHHQRYLLKEMLREMEDDQWWFLEELDELEEQVFWCLDTINRTRRLVTQQLGSESL